MGSGMSFELAVFNRAFFVRDDAKGPGDSGTKSWWVFLMVEGARIDTAVTAAALQK